MQDKIRSVIATVLGLPIDAIQVGFTMQSTDKWDSLAHMQLMAAIEEAFDLPEPLSLDEMITMTNFEAIAAVLASKGLS